MSFLFKFFTIFEFTIKSVLSSNHWEETKLTAKVGDFNTGQYFGIWSEGDLKA